MSKSIGNVIDPDDVINGTKDGKMPSYGVDVLRWWVASSGLHANVSIGKTILAKYHEEIFKLRKSCRFLLGNLFNFSPSEHLVSYELLLPQDRYMLHLLFTFAQKLSQQYANHRYNKITSSIEKFINSDVSSFYSTIIKDRCYCDMPDGFSRCSCQTLQYHLLHTILCYMAPILPHFAEELFQHMPKPFEYDGFESVFMIPVFKVDPQWFNLDIFQDMQPILTIKEFMPVYWSPSSQTALAESELVYNPDHISQSCGLHFLLLKFQINCVNQFRNNSWTNCYSIVLIYMSVLARLLHVYIDFSTVLRLSPFETLFSILLAVNTFVKSAIHSGYN